MDDRRWTWSGLVPGREDAMQDLDELTWFFSSYEAEVGFRSTFSAMLAAANGVAHGSGPPSSWDPYADVVDVLSRGARVYRTLRHLGTADLVVLHRLYGPRRPDELAAFGDLAPLADLTPAAEAVRDEHVLEASEARYEAASASAAAGQAHRRQELAETFWGEAGRLQRLDRRPPSPERDRRIAATWAFLGQLADAARYDGTIRAGLGAIESTDREVTVAAALRDRLARLRGDERRDFVALVRREAMGLRDRAVTAYRTARRGPRRLRRAA